MASEKETDPAEKMSAAEAVAATIAVSAAAPAAALAALAACRNALLDGPAATRVALTKYRGSIDSAVYRTLEIVGSYDLEVIVTVNSAVCCCSASFH